MTLEVLAPAKVTLSLRITGVRDDGYHLIDAEMTTVDLYDYLTLSDGDGLEVIEAGCGLPVPDGDQNLVSRALALVRRQAMVRIVKAIPAGVGLGGGSADAAAVLRWAAYGDPRGAAILGADVPFCLVGGRARVSGTGEVVEQRPFEERTITLLVPPLSCPTGEVYRRWDEMGGPSGETGNDLEPAAIDLVPELARWRDALGEATGECPRMAGSGSSWFVDGAFPGKGRRVVKTLPAS